MKKIIMVLTTWVLATSALAFSAVGHSSSHVFLALQSASNSHNATAPSSNEGVRSVIDSCDKVVSDICFKNEDNSYACVSLWFTLIVTITAICYALISFWRKW